MTIMPISYQIYLYHKSIRYGKKRGERSQLCDLNPHLSQQKLLELKLLSK